MKTYVCGRKRLLWNGKTYNPGDPMPDDVSVKRHMIDAGLVIVVEPSDEATDAVKQPVTHSVGESEGSTADLSKMSKADLKALAKEKGHTGLSKMNKGDLVALLSD